MPTNPDPNDRNNQLDALRRLARENGLLPEMFKEDDLANVLNSQRPKIKLPGDRRELSEFAKEIGGIVSKQGLFRRDRTPVITNPEKKRLDVMTADMLRTWVEDHLVCFREKSTGSGEDERTLTISRTMNVDTARGTLEAIQFLKCLYEIDRVNETRMPVMLEDKRIELLRPGYFPERRIYTFDDGLKLDEEMSIDQARKVIDDLLRYFPFANERSKSVAISAMLTMFCATLLPKDALRPGFILTANSPGAGKTLLVKVAVIPVVGACSVRTFPRKEEAKKVLDIVAMDASSYVLFDNIRGVIAGEEIEAFITSSIIEGRILGESTKFRVDNVATVFLTGNESTTSQDMQDRCMFVELFVQEADNRDRKIPFVIDDKYLSAPTVRARILSALWSFVRDWDANGRKEPAGQPLPRFDDWSRIIGGIIINAGYSDPLTVPELPNLGAIEGKEMKELVKALAPIVRNSEPPKIDVEPGALSPWKFAEIIDKVQELGLFADVEIRRGKNVEDMFTDGEITPAGKSHFGKMLLRYNGRIFAVDGALMRFVVKGKGNTRKFEVVCERQPGTPEQPF